jgi:hypothetical protein
MRYALESGRTRPIARAKRPATVREVHQGPPQGKRWFVRIQLVLTLYMEIPGVQLCGNSDEK